MGCLVQKRLGALSSAAIQSAVAPEPDACERPKGRAFTGNADALADQPDTTATAARYDGLRCSHQLRRELVGCGLGSAGMSTPRRCQQRAAPEADRRAAEPRRGRQP